MRRIVIVRHGERVDYTFGHEWIDNCFDNQGKYQKNNLNMPDNVIQRAGLPRSFYKDGPLTQTGQLQGHLVGKGLLQENVLRAGFEVYVSPSYRSIQTAAALMEGMRNTTPLKIELGLFEWTGWYPEGIPRFVTQEELLAADYNIDASYESIQKMSELKPFEEIENYYNRTYELVKKLLDGSDKDILLVAHGSTLEVGTRQLMCKPARTTEKDFMKVLHEVPYAALGIVDHNPASNSWAFHRNDRLCLKHSAVRNFDPIANFVRD